MTLGDRPSRADAGLDIVATLRDGSEHTLLLDTLAGNGDAAHVLAEISAGRSQLLRGWVAVRPQPGATQAVVSGSEIMQLRLVERTG
jgi:hypothetical protein